MPQSTNQFFPIQISGKLHAAVRVSTDSFTKLSLTFSGELSPKWHFTASRTIVSKSSQLSPCVAINPPGIGQLAENPPSASGVTVKTSSLMELL